jgi:membrane protease YdiL (CAAX protease family)
MKSTFMNEEISPSPSPSFFSRIFIGAQGIRAGWSIGIFLLCMTLMTLVFVYPAEFILGQFHIVMSDKYPLTAFVGEFAGFLGLLAASMTMALIEHKPLIFYGLEGKQRPIKFFMGFISGMLALSTLVGVLYFFDFLVFDGQSLYGWGILQYGLEWSAAFLMVGLFEEYFMRGYMQVTLTRGIGFWWSAMILSIMFGCIHLFNPGETPVGICSAAIIGFLFCVSLWYLKNLWWAIGFHTAWDWAESYLWGTADSGKVVEGHLFSVHPQGNALWSGGSTGPEGSLMIIPLLLIIALLMWIRWRNVKVKEMSEPVTTRS